MLIGYARVSTEDQNTDMQIRALQKAGAVEIVQEKTSAVSRRPELHKLLDRLTCGDTLVVYKLDRIARSLKDLLRIMETLERTGAGFNSLTETIDTTTPAGRLMLQMLGAFAEFERSLIRERTIAGQVAAIARGAFPGRPRKFDLATEAEIFALSQQGFTKSELARRYHCTEYTIRMIIDRAIGVANPRLQPRRPVLGPIVGYGHWQGGVSGS